MKDPFAPSGRPRLKPLDVDGWPGMVELVGDRLTVGRSEDNDVTLAAGSFPSVSGHHVRFEWREDSLWAVDLDSRNGMLVNGDRVGERRLAFGDVVQLGAAGPKFLVAGARKLDETMFVDPRAVGLEHGPTQYEVEDLVRRRTRTNFARMAVLTALLVAAFAWWSLDSSRRSAAERRALEGELASAGLAHEEELQAAWSEIAELERRAARRDTEFLERERERDELLRGWESRQLERQAQLAQRIEEREDDERQLLARLDAVERADGSAAEIEALRQELSEARAQLATTRTDLVDAKRSVEMLDPVNLTQARLSGVSQVRRSVVLIETELRLRHTLNGRLLHQVGEGPLARPNFEGEGEVWSLESTGSGFCVSEEGWILSNAHVVRPPEDNEVLRATRGLPIAVEFDVEVVFSDTDVRHEAHVVRVAEGDVDLALLRIEPFPGIPHLSDFDPDTPPPPAGSDLFLFGFPLGHFALQEGERVIASTFRGILSRNVGGQMQVDAGVHPGNSGGPITDIHGRVIGVVYSVQALPDRSAVYTIGYGIPITEARSVWPPPDDDELDGEE